MTRVAELSGSSRNGGRARRSAPRVTPPRRDRGARAAPSRPRRADAPLRLHPDPQRRHGRRQHRQRLADRRPAAGADRARRAPDAAARARSGGRSRSRISSSPTASRTARRANSSKSVFVPRLAADMRFACYKLSKRFDQDISAVMGAFRLTLEGGMVASDVRIAFGGMAATPEARRRCRSRACRAGHSTSATIERAAAALAEDFAPITDMRASAGYRLQGGAEPAAALPPGERRRGDGRDARAGARAMDETLLQIAERPGLSLGAACDPPRTSDPRRRAHARSRTTAPRAMSPARRSMSTTSRSRPARCTSMSR